MFPGVRKINGPDSSRSNEVARSSFRPGIPARVGIRSAALRERVRRNINSRTAVEEYIYIYACRNDVGDTGD